MVRGRPGRSGGVACGAGSQLLKRALAHSQGNCEALLDPTVERLTVPEVDAQARQTLLVGTFATLEKSLQPSGRGWKVQRADHRSRARLLVDTDRIQAFGLTGP